MSQDLGWVPHVSFWSPGGGGQGGPGRTLLCQPLEHEAKQDYASPFLVSTLSHLLIFHWQSKLHGQVQHPCYGEIHPVHCSALEGHMTEKGGKELG